MTFSKRFAQATQGKMPYPYQVRLATEPWPEVLSVPTGMGKTAAVGLAWIHRRMERDSDTPRRLVFVLPMRVLAEQTVASFRTWLDRLGVLGEPGDGADKISVSLLMGGSDDVRRADWAAHPEDNAVLVGTQDMLLSRALMRGYGMSRYQWPIHYALLHTDAMWVFDEVQLMGSALSTSSQLEAFRRASPPAFPSRSMWISATLRPEWLGSVDFREHLDSLSVLELGSEDYQRATHLLEAPKSLERAPFRLEKETGSNRGNGVTAIAELVGRVHRHGTQTLVIVNRVDRAQEVYRHLAADLARRAEGAREDLAPELFVHQHHIPAELLLLHARFRPAERREIERKLMDETPAAGRIVVATQAVEAGVDISSTTLVVELAPWASMVQRFGRNNRYGEVPGGGRVIWIDSDFEADPKSMAPPYNPDDLTESRQILESLDGAGIADLPDFAGKMAPGPVLRRKDFLQLFDTDPDLSGYDIDVAPYIRDQGTPPVQVFWRAMQREPGRKEPSPDPGAPAPDRAELCPVSLTQLAEYARKTVRKTPRSVWVWDPILERWDKRDGRTSRFLPGAVYQLPADLGGYDPVLGFDPGHTAPVDVITIDGPDMPAYGADAASEGVPGQPESLIDHSRAVRREAGALAIQLALPRREAEVLVDSALWHDIGKAHPASRTAMRDAAGEALPDTILAKSGGRSRLRYRIVGEDGKVTRRQFFRHEVASMLAWLEHNNGHAHRDLVAYLIAAHHGKVRMGLRALPREQAAPDGRRYARGIWDGDTLPPLELPAVHEPAALAEPDKRAIPETTLSLQIMELGLSAAGPSWTERTHGLLDEWGPFRLAWLEALLRIADWRGSAASSAANGGNP